MKALLTLAVFFSLSAQAIPIEGHKLMISGPSEWAVATGRRIFAEGGNVADVAVAIGLSLSVTTPYYASLGGGGCAVIKMKKDVEAIDFREAAPAATGKGYYKNLPKDASITGGQAVAVPGFPAGLAAIHAKYGKLPWAKLFGEAMKLAQSGFPVSGEWVQKAENEKGRFNPAGREAFFKKGFSSYKPGEILKQPDLALALKQLELKKDRGFYEGPVAADLVKSVAAAGGALSLEDLKNYRVRWLKPITTLYNGYKLYLMPPPSSGGTIIKTALALIEKINLKSKAPLSVDELHLLSEVESRAFRERALLADPDYSKNPIEMVTSDQYITDLAKSIDPKKATSLPELPQTIKDEKAETTHFSVMDDQGHAIALTVTLNGTYGSAVVTNKYHIALNDEMDDFTTRPNEPNMYGLRQGLANQVEPGKRPLSSMSPTLVERDGGIVMSLGAPGGPRITSSVLQALYRVLGQNKDIDTAIQFPRVHDQFAPEKVFVDQGRFSPEILQMLKDKGHVISEGRGMGKVYIVRLRPDGVLEGAFDARGEGAAGGI